MKKDRECTITAYSRLLSEYSSLYYNMAKEKHTINIPEHNKVRCYLSVCLIGLKVNVVVFPIVTNINGFSIEKQKEEMSRLDATRGFLSFLLLKTSDIFRKAVHSVVRFARDYYKPRFDAEQVSDIKNALSLFGEDRQSHRVAGDFLYFTAKQKGVFDNREQIKARREVDNVVEGNYDQQQKKGFSVRR